MDLVCAVSFVIVIYLLVIGLGKAAARGRSK